MKRNGRNRAPEDLSILPAIQFRRDGDLSTIARRVGMRADVLGKKIRTLEQRSLITPGVLVNNFLLGYRDLCLLFSPSVERAKDAQRIVTFLRNHPMVSWFAEFAGEYRYAASVFVRNTIELATFLESSYQHLGPVISSRLMAERTSLQVFPYRFYGNPKIFESPLVSAQAGALIPFDEQDAQVLSALSKNAAASSRDLVQATGLPQTTVSYRLRKLREAGVLMGYTWLHNWDELGYQAYRLVIVSQAPSQKQRKLLEQFCAQEPLVSLLVCCVGAWDYELSVIARDSTELRGLLQRLRDCLGDQLAKLHVLQSLTAYRARWFPSALEPQR